MKRRSTPFPRYTTNYQDRHGKWRSEFRRGAVRVSLPEPLLGPEYWEAYRAALADYIAGREPGRRSEVGAERTKPGTVAAAFIAYTGSAAFKNGLADSTQKVHFNILSRWRDQWGDRRLSQLQRRHVIDWLNERAETPAAAQVFLKVLRRLMQYCISIDLLENDPTHGVKPPKYRTVGYHTWTDAEIAQYRQRHPLGTNARLALELLLDTAQRRQDVVRMGRQHLRNGGCEIHVKQQKTGWEGDIPIGPELAAPLTQVPMSNLTFLTTAWGAPYTAAGFGNAFRDWRNEAGLPKHCVMHGLRKAQCRQLAEKGCTPHEIQAISGHITLAEVQRYTKAVDQARLARIAKAKNGTKIAEPPSGFGKIGS
jgi:site-specific recombinase XerD